MSRWALQKGAADFLPKPVNPSILRARVMTQLRLAHANGVLKQLSAIDRLNLAAAMEELRTSNTNLQTTVDELAATNGRLSQFVRIASHDLREPLNTVDQFAGLIEEDDGPRLSDSGRQYLRLVRKAGARMRTLLDDVVQLRAARCGPRRGHGRGVLADADERLEGCLGRPAGSNPGGAGGGAPARSGAGIAACSLWCSRTCWSTA